MSAHGPAIPLRLRSATALTVASLIGLAAFCWPLLMTPAAGIEHGGDAPWLFAVMLPLLIAVVAAELADGGMDAKAVAMLGVLAAVGAALRPLGGGATGFQPMFVVIVIGGYVFGAGFGFTLGATSMLGSALLTGGVGPWLPFQMLAAAWVGLGAGLLPRLTERRELLVVAGYGAVASLLFGLVMNLSFWPWATTTASSLGYVAGAPAAENLGRFVAFHLATSMGWDLTRALGTVVLVFALGAPAIAALRRAARRAAFTAPIVFVPAEAPDPAIASPPTSERTP
jgi:energy-coupling factor transport system substrate-specific component